MYRHSLSELYVLFFVVVVVVVVVNTGVKIG